MVDFSTSLTALAGDITSNIALNMPYIFQVMLPIGFFLLVLGVVKGLFSKR